MNCNLQLLSENGEIAFSYYKHLLRFHDKVCVAVQNNNIENILCQQQSEEITTRILAIETSCDETAAAVVENGRKILSNVIASQVDIHAEFGGRLPRSCLAQTH